jgi:hypothetical protein
MDAKFMHKAPIRNAPAAERIGEDGTGLCAQGSALDRACCCAAKAAVRVTMPPNPSRRHSTELLLCGHHYRVSRQALAAAGAVVRELPGTPPDVSAWIGAGGDKACAS